LSASGWASVSRSPVGGSESGRWPANLIHDGSEEVIRLFPYGVSTASDTQQPIKTSKGIKGGSFGNHSARRPEGHQTHSEYVRGGFNDAGSAARFFYCAKANKKDRGNDNTHPTVKPTDLMRYLCRLVTPPGGIVLDPFAGSGSTGKAAILEGFRFVGIEKETEYVAIANARICEAENAKGLFK
jgi:site-specific DNA-methyltransferase (adenine-specific)